MAIKLLLAKPETGEDIKEAAMLHVQLWNTKEPEAVHKLKLRRDSEGDWHPELHLGMEVCWGKTVEACLMNIQNVLELLVQTIEEHSGSIPELADWLEPQKPEDKKK